MDIALDLIKDLWSSLTPVTFLQALGIIIFLTYFLVSFFLKKKKEGGFVAALFKGEETENVELKEIREKLAVFTVNHDQLMSKLFLSVQQISNNAADAVKEAKDEVKDRLANYNSLRMEMESSKSEIFSEIDDVKQWFKLHDQNVTQMSQNLKDMLQRVLDLLAKMNTQLEKIDEFCRSTMPEFREDTREINRGITELSKDIALIERTIQTQVGIQSVKLR